MQNELQEFFNVDFEALGYGYRGFKNGYQIVAYFDDRVNLSILLYGGKQIHHGSGRTVEEAYESVLSEQQDFLHQVADRLAELKALHG